MKTILTVFGTRPDAIKMCPLVSELRSRGRFDVKVCVTGQHRGMLDGVLGTFGVAPDTDLSVMRDGQTLQQLTSRILDRLDPVLGQTGPAAVLVHGDTTTAFCAALASYYRGIPVGHVEAGLRTYVRSSPFPEEFNRQAVSMIADFSFAPTEEARMNLLREGRRPESVFVTGNTVADALRMTLRADYSHPALEWAAGSRLVLVTAHRRENLGGPMRGMFRAIRRAVWEHGDVKVLFPVHPNPLVREAAREIFGGCDRVRLAGPMDVVDFHNILSRCHMVLTDSGGIQEEACCLGRPTLVMRDGTERPEGIAAGTLRLTGTGEDEICAEFSRLLDDPAAYSAMCRPSALYGDGRASARIADALEGLLL
jgi:UDP-N-acetylglucosamine 2-epimerase (non-hydrolysing)